MKRSRKGVRSSPKSARQLAFQSRVASSLVLSGLALACTYQPLTDTEKAGLGAAGSGAEAGDETTSAVDSGIGGSGQTSATGGSGGTTDGPQSATDTTSGTDATSSGGAINTSSTGSGGSVGTGGTTSSGGAASSGGGAGTGGTAGSDATGGSAGTAGSDATGGSGAGGSGGTAGASGSGGVAGSGGTSQASTFRYVRIVATSSQNGKPFTAIAELELLDENGQPIDNSSFTASADSEETLDEMAPASQAIDGDPDTFWHTEWGAYEAPLPHYLQIDLGSAREITGFIYTPRQDGLQNGWILDWEFYLSNSASDPGTAVDSGSFASGTSSVAVTLP